MTQDSPASRLAHLLPAVQSSALRPRADGKGRGQPQQDALEGAGDAGRDDLEVVAEVGRPVGLALGLLSQPLAQLQHLHAGSQHQVEGEGPAEGAEADAQVRGRAGQFEWQRPGGGRAGARRGGAAKVVAVGGGGEGGGGRGGGGGDSRGRMVLANQEGEARGDGGRGRGGGGRGGRGRRRGVIVPTFTSTATTDAAAVDRAAAVTLPVTVIKFTVLVIIIVVSVYEPGWWSLLDGHLHVVDTSGCSPNQPRHSYAYSWRWIKTVQ